MAAFPVATGAVVELIAGNQLTYFSGAGILAEYTGLRLMQAGSLSGVAIEGRSVVRCTDTETDGRVNAEACRRIGLRSMCIAPLYSGDRLRLVGWKTKRGSYWVSNTLLQTLSEGEMLGVARSLRRAG